MLIVLKKKPNNTWRLLEMVTHTKRTKLFSVLSEVKWVELVVMSELVQASHTWAQLHTVRVARPLPRSWRVTN